jgi:hypothetical protein
MQQEKRRNDKALPALSKVPDAKNNQNYFSISSSNCSRRGLEAGKSLFDVSPIYEDPLQNTHG